MTEPPGAIEWTVWPVRRRPVRGAFGAAIALATIAIVARLSGAPLAVVAALVLFVSLSPFYVPTRHRLDAAGVEVVRLGRRTRRPWSALRSVHANDTICLLSPFEGRSWLESYRGVTLLLDGNRAAVVPYAEAMVGTARGRDGGARG
jgi:hypothetical protein